MLTVRGDTVDPIEVTHLLNSVGKSDEECQSFFGPLTWAMPGFAIEVLRNWVAARDWASLYKKGWDK